MFDELMIQSEFYIDLNVKKSQVFRFYLELTIAHVYLITTYCFDVHFWININGASLSLIISCVWYYVEMYSILITLLLLHNYSAIIRSYLNQLNRTLEKLISCELVKAHKINCTFGTIWITKNNDDDVIKCTGNMLDAYTHLSNTINMFNEIFGSKIVMIFVIDLFGMWHTADILTRVLISSESLPGTTIANITLWTILLIVSTDTSIQILAT